MQPRAAEQTTTVPCQARDDIVGLVLTISQELDVPTPQAVQEPSCWSRFPLSRNASQCLRSSRKTGSPCVASQERVQNRALDQNVPSTVLQIRVEIALMIQQVRQERQNTNHGAECGLPSAKDHRANPGIDTACTSRAASTNHEADCGPPSALDHRETRENDSANSTEAASTNHGTDWRHPSATDHGENHGDV